MEGTPPVRPERRGGRAARRSDNAVPEGAPGGAAAASGSVVHPDGVLRGPPLSSPLPKESLGVVLLRGMRRHGSRDALVDVVTGEATTYSDLVGETLVLARALRVLLDDIQGERDAKAERRRRDVDQHHDVVGVFMENRREMLPCLVANLLLGSPISLLNALSNTGELVSAWRATRPTVSLCSRATLAVVLEAARSLPTLRHVVVFPGAAPDAPEDSGDGDVAAAAAAVRASLHAVAYEDLLTRVAPEEAVGTDNLLDILRPVEVEQHVAFLLQCGRGGRIARLTHRNLTYTVQLLGEPDAAGYGWSGDDVLLLGAPLSHAFGLGVCLGALKLGVKVVLMPHFREQLFLSAVHAHKVTQLVLVPGQAAVLARSPLLEDAVVPRGGVRGLLRGVVCAAAPLPRALHRDLTRRLAAPCRQAYGLTQASCSLLVAPRGAPPDTQGMVVPGAEAKVVAVGKARTLGPHQVGELLLRAPSIMAGYLDQDDDAMDADGWLRTGDLAYYDAKGCVFVVDRLRDVALYTHFKEFDDAHTED